MNKEETIARLLDPGIIAIVRARSPASLSDVAEALYAGGVRAIEATMTTPGALDSIRSLPRETRAKMAVGVGTALRADDAHHAVDAGAAFVVTPVLRLDVVAACREMGVPVACGAFTPTEALAAHEAGADFVKIFPAEICGPAYIKAILAPLPMLRIIPTGGVSPETCGPFLKAGCVALGAGSRLVSDDILESRDWEKLTERARQFVEAAQAAKTR
ncbi:MAG TPA: bifunctional 4-hydroxy-2-oxoglutarate aldolase/2-dehydro-3-deoxy-phosphogluconate aldolase [Fimbriimonadaceae bacterium]|nr:bifunctional 4-hydroxy-2-oxoglutarate aldolase/2-dehydro-3-deoxy-phosphogluconate aldolase [Fimbriimonadaceae bacterium]